MSEHRQIISNTLAGAASSMVSVATNIGVTALLISNLSENSFGVWSSMLLLTFSQGYFALLDLGTSVGAVRQAASKKTSPENERDIFGALQRIYGVVAVCASIATVPIATAIFNNTEQTDQGMHWVAVFSIALRPLLEMLTHIRRLRLESKSHYRDIAFFDSIYAVVWLLTVLYLSFVNFNLSALFFFSGIISLFKLLTMIFLCRTRTLKAVFIRPTPGLQITLLREGVVALLPRLLAVVHNQMDRTLLLSFAGITAVGYYEIPYKFQALTVMAMSIFPAALIPAVARINSQGDSSLISEIYLRGTAWSTRTVIPIAVSLMLLTKPILTFWLGPSYTFLTNSVRLILLWPLFDCFNSIAGALLAGLGQMRVLLRLSLISVSVNFFVSVVLVRKLGLNGVIIGTTAGTFVVFFPYLFSQLRATSVDIFVWISRIFVPAALSCVFTLISYFGISLLYDSSANVFATFASLGLTMLAGWTSVLLFSDTRSDLIRFLIRRKQG